MAIMTKIDTSKTTWDLSPLLDGDDDPKIKQYREAMTVATEAFAKKWRNRKDYLQDPSILKEALDEMEKWECLPGLGNENFYFHLQLARDAASAVYQAKNSQAAEFIQGIITQLQFFWINIGNIPKVNQAHFLESPHLADYRHLIQRRFVMATHQLSEAEEKLMLLKNTVAHQQWIEMTERFLSQGERKVRDENGKQATATIETLMTLLSSSNKKVRDEAATQFNSFLKDYLPVAESEMNAILANKKIDDEVRHFERPDAARHLEDDIETPVVDALLEAVSFRNDISQKFYALKAKLLKLPQLAYHERNVPYGAVEKTYTYEESIDTVYEVFKSMDPEFGAIFKRFVEAGQVDTLPKKGKRGGAFCTISNINHPVYVLLNFTGKLRDVTTIAHEFGHAINHELAKRQKALNYGISVATAEVASTFLESQVLLRLLEEADEELRLALLVDQLNGCVSTIFRQTAFYRFEEELHQQFRKQGHLTYQEIGRIFQKHTKTYMGPAVEQSAGAENWWLYIPHFRDFFYVYAYTSGELISMSLQAKVKRDKIFIKEIKEKFLSSGTESSVSQKFASMGIDITDKTFWEQGLDEIDQLLKDTEALAKKLGKI